MPNCRTTAKRSDQDCSTYRNIATADCDAVQPSPLGFDDNSSWCSQPPRMSSGSEYDDREASGEELEQTSAQPEDEAKVVPRDYLPTDSAITNTHVAAAFADEYHKATESQKASWLNAMKKERQDCRSWAAMKVEQMFVEEARNQGLSVSTLEEIKGHWMKDGSDKMAGKMFQILYGTFDSRPNWARKLEQEYMTTYKNYVYSKEATTVGCFESLISHRKSAMVVTVNNATKSTHNRRINISRKKDMINENNRFKKRKKGIFQPYFVRGEDAAEDSEEENKNKKPKALKVSVFERTCKGLQSTDTKE